MKLTRVLKIHVSRILCPDPGRDNRLLEKSGIPHVHFQTVQPHQIHRRLGQLAEPSCELHVLL